ncbi:amino acid permease/ SLC12A domain-containing protein [Massariosphaeria phaeospora]|uniref:Amino acid permease/ SLC12A domain-containing protein n=1 Tax=Massariosphaeria phaeospora TaxID=100035 RepID=A0A7C8MAJ2_9PLEO|nr:amino acid permease/ SLC12A domain-containing protein [Massariosphaeria phaeospora]
MDINPHVNEGELPQSRDYGAETKLQRLLTTRHVTMIALGSSIGMGLWLGSGKSLASGGPAGIILGYLLAASMIWSVSHSLGEMAVMYPLPSAFVQWTGKFVSPAAAFALGWAYWFSYCITIANELQAVVTIMGFWTDKVPVAAWITVWWLVIIAVDVFAVNVFGEIEVICSSIKFGWIFVVIISLTTISAGGPFINGFKRFLSVMPTCIFAMAGSENSGLVAAETAKPRKAVPRAVGSIWLRLSLFYILGALMVTINVDPKDKDIFGGKGTNASPFVIAYRQADLQPLAHMMNAIIFISVVSTGTISAYAGSRTQMGLAHLGMAPAAFKKADSTGRPWWGLFITLLLGGGLGYLNVNHSAADVFTWFSNLTSLFTLFGWGMICLSHIRMRYAWQLQGRPVADLPWKSWTFPYAAWWGLSWCIILIVAEFYLSVWPLGARPSAEHFFANYISVIVIILCYLGARLYYRGPWWVDASTIDLDATRRFYGVIGAAGRAVQFIFN